MNKEKQIEEIALDLNNMIHFKDNGLVARYATAEAMYDLGYRKQSKWISVEDKLPDKEGCYIVTEKNGNGKVYVTERVLLYWANGPSWCMSWQERDIDKIKVTHWMPLPAPPTDKEN